MNEDRRRSEEYVAERDSILRSWMSATVYPYSPVLRQSLDAAGLGRRGVRAADDLTRLPTTSVAELATGRRHVLEPTAEAIAGHGPWSSRMRLRLADAFGRRPELAREQVDPEFRPLLWTMSGPRGHPLFTASTASDLDELGDIGRRALSVSGVHADDRMLVLDPAGGRIGPWQLLAGAREAGIPTLHADEPGRELVETAGATVLAGRASTLVAAIASGPPESVRLLVVHDGPVPDAGQRGALDASGLPVAEWWTPPAGRAAWVRCPGGSGFHIWPTHEVVEVLDHAGAPAARGELAWSPVGWRGSVWLRVRTGVRVAVDPAPCGCGRTTPRVQLLPAETPRHGRHRKEPVRA